MRRFSLVIPTLRRAETLEHALATLLAQQGDDVQILVQNNGDDPATREVVERAADPRVEHRSSVEVVPMAENWERALAAADGDYVTFIGDDDGLLPDACRVARAVLDGDAAEILSWEPFSYFWPSYWDERRRNTLLARVSSGFRVRPVTAAPLLARCLAFEAHYSKLPMLYNSFVSRSLLERARARHGRYFVGALPDVTSGVVNATYADTFLKSERALSIAGISGHSMGQRVRHSDAWSPDELARGARQLTGRSAPGLEEAIAAELELLAREVVRERHDLAFDERGAVRSLAAAINEAPTRYEATKAVILARMRDLGLRPDEVSIPAPLELPPIPPLGTHDVGGGEVLHVLDGADLGLRSIADATRAALQLVPPPEAMTVSTSLPFPDGVPVVSTEPLSFARNEDGSLALVSGWAEPESWGAWSVERESILRVRLAPRRGRRRLRLALRYRTVQLDTERELEIAWGEEPPTRRRLPRQGHEGELVFDVPRRLLHAPVDVRFVNLNARSPSSMGIGEDQRPLGIGVEALRTIR
jgi:hypothetical protein